MSDSGSCKPMPPNHGTPGAQRPANPDTGTQGQQGSLPSGQGNPGGIRPMPQNPNAPRTASMAADYGNDGGQKPMPKEWQIIVQSLDGTSYNFAVSESTTVMDLKRKIQARTRLSCEEQRLIYGGKQLEDHKRICDYDGIGKDATIDLVVRLRGGSRASVCNSSPAAR